MKIDHLYISPEHNFFGHYGQPAGTAAVVDLDAVECVAGKGLKGDRFFKLEPGKKGQVTFFSREVFESMSASLGIHDKDPSVLRRNIVVSGADLNSLIGQEFELQGVRFFGVEECSPCFWMNEAMGSGAEAFLQGQGGLRCRVLSSGELRKDSQ